MRLSATFCMSILTICKFVSGWIYSPQFQPLQYRQPKSPDHRNDHSFSELRDRNHPSLSPPTYGPIHRPCVRHSPTATGGTRRIAPDLIALINDCMTVRHYVPHSPPKRKTPLLSDDIRPDRTPVLFRQWPGRAHAGTAGLTPHAPIAKRARLPLQRL